MLSLKGIEMQSFLTFLVHLDLQWFAAFLTAPAFHLLHPNASLLSAKFICSECVYIHPSNLTTPTIRNFS